MVIMSEWKECDHIKPINVYDIAIKIAMAEYACHFLNSLCFSKIGYLR